MRNDREYEEELYREVLRQQEAFYRDRPEAARRRRRRRRRRKQNGCCGCCILPLLVCLALLFFFRDRYPVTIVRGFLNDRIINTSEDPILVFPDSSAIAQDSVKENSGVPVDSQGADSSAKDTTESAVPVSFEPIDALTGICYRSMTEEQQDVYEQLYAGILSCEKEFHIEAGNAEEIGDILNGILADNPQFFWLDGAASIYGFEHQARKRIELEFNCDPDDIMSISEQIDAEAQRFIQTLSADASDYDKVKAAYEFVINNVSYEVGCRQSQNIQSSMIDHVSVCAGYSKELQYLLRRVGVECSYITGTVVRNEVMESHAWNLVKIDDTYTYVDTTWGDPSYVMNSEAARELPDISYNYLCLTTEEMRRTGHVADEDYDLPECTSDAYDYYIQSGRFYEYCDSDAVRMQIRNAVDNNISDVHMKFASLEAYYEAKMEIFDGGMLSEELQNRMKWDGLSTITYYPLTNDDLRTIEILW